MTVLNCISALDSIPQPSKPHRSLGVSSMSSSSNCVTTLLQVLPNRVIDHALITYGSDLELRRYRVFSSAGEMVETGILSKGGLTELNVSKLTSGIYQLQVIEGKRTIGSTKFIVQ